MGKKSKKKVDITDSDYQTLIRAGISDRQNDFMEGQNLNFNDFVKYMRGGNMTTDDYLTYMSHAEILFPDAPENARSLYARARAGGIKDSISEIAKDVVNIIGEAVTYIQNSLKEEESVFSDVLGANIGENQKKCLEHKDAFCKAVSDYCDAGHLKDDPYFSFIGSLTKIYLKSNYKNMFKQSKDSKGNLEIKPKEFLPNFDEIYEIAQNLATQTETVKNSQKATDAIINITQDFAINEEKKSKEIDKIEYDTDKEKTTEIKEEPKKKEIKITDSVINRSTIIAEQTNIEQQNIEQQNIYIDKVVVESEKDKDDMKVAKNTDYLKPESPQYSESEKVDGKTSIEYKDSNVETNDKKLNKFKIYNDETAFKSAIRDIRRAEDDDWEQIQEQYALMKDSIEKSAIRWARRMIRMGTDRKNLDPGVLYGFHKPKNMKKYDKKEQEEHIVKSVVRDVLLADDESWEKMNEEYLDMDDSIEKEALRITIKRIRSGIDRKKLDPDLTYVEYKMHQKANN